MMDMAFDPGNSAWQLGADGAWTRVATAPDGTPLKDVQETLIARATRRAGA